MMRLSAVSRVLPPFAPSLVGSSLLLACASAPADGPRDAQAVLGSCAAGARPVATPLPRQGSSSGLAVGRLPSGGLVAFASDPDDGSVVSIDVTKKQVVGAMPVGPGERQVLLLADGRLLVSGPRGVVVAHPQPDGKLAEGCVVDVGGAVSALAQSPDGQTVLVASGGAGKLTRLDAKLSVGKSFEVAPDPRAVLITRDGKTALVSHAGRPTLEVVDLATNQKEGEIALSLSPFDSAEDDPDAPASLSLRMKAALQETAPTPSEPGGRSAAQSYALVETSDPPGRVLLPHVLVDRGDQGSPQKFYGGHGTRHVPVVSVLDLAARRVVRPPGSFDAMMQFEEERFGPGRRNGSDRCLLPRSAAIDDATGTVLVGCAGVDSLVAYDARSVEPQAVERARFGVGTYPNGIAVDASARRAYVWGAHERVLDIVDLDALYAGRLTKREKVQLERPRTPPSLGMMLGRQMFYASGDIRIASDGVACASCHPDGGDDGAVWITDGGPRRTKRLDVPRQGELLGWEGRHAGLGAFVEYEIEQLGGSGLRGVQLEALLTYVEQLRPAAAPGGEEAGALARHGCSACHAAAQGKAQDVGSRTRFDRRGEFLAPSLFGLAARGPYFHDGRFPTLESLLAAPHHERGKQMVLSEQDRADLLAALLAMRSGEAR